MKKVLVFLLFISIFISMFTASVCAEDVSVSAQAYVLYCVNNGEVILSNNENEKLPMASTTKLMTTIIALEQSDVLSREVEFTEDMIAEGSSMYLGVGECVTLYDLCVGMMMQSGNDAANAAAINIGGSIEEFSALMNKKAEEINMVNSHFVTPSGLDDENHYSTAYDMALLMSYAISNNSFKEITKQKSMSVSFIKPSDKTVTYPNHNKLLSMYDYCIGGKTGYTDDAGRCLVSVAEKDSLTFVCVTLNDRNDWQDHIGLYDYAFENYKALDQSMDSDITVDVVGSNRDNITASIEKANDIVLKTDDAESVKRKVYLQSFFYAPIIKGEQIGKVVYENDNGVIVELPILANDDATTQKEDKTIIEKIKEFLHW